MEEIWKNICEAGYEDYYQVSNLGRVKRVKCGKQNRWGTDRYLHYNINNGGYHLVGLCVNNNPIKRLVHRLVWEAFNGTIPEGMQVNHINEDKSDNRLENLNLMTSKENNNWGTKKERLSKSGMGKQTKAVNQYDLKGNFIRKWDSIVSVTRKLDIGSSDISNCCHRRKNKTAGGYIWRFA